MMSVIASLLDEISSTQSRLWRGTRRERKCGSLRTFTVTTVSGKGFYIRRKSRRDVTEGAVFPLRRDLHLHEHVSNERLGTDTH